MRVKRLGATRAVITVGATVGLALALFAPAAGAGKGPTQAAPLTVLKTVTGTAPAGTTFTATVACDDDIIYTGEESIAETTVTFAADGQPTSADTIYFTDPGQCTVTETVKGGANTTTYACEGDAPADETDKQGVFTEQVGPIDVVCETTGPGPITVNIFDEEQQGTVTIHNTFDPVLQPIQPAAQVVAQPAFTG
jgi:hypothetical protein